MNVDKLIHKYFKGNQPTPTIEVFDNDTIYNTYTEWDLDYILHQD